jgi:hypothetical protein
VKKWDTRNSSLTSGIISRGVTFEENHPEWASHLAIRGAIYLEALLVKRSISGREKGHTQLNDRVIRSQPYHPEGGYQNSVTAPDCAVLTPKEAAGQHCTLPSRYRHRLYYIEDESEDDAFREDWKARTLT